MYDLHLNTVDDFHLILLTTELANSLKELKTIRGAPVSDKVAFEFCVHHQRDH